MKTLNLFHMNRLYITTMACLAFLALLPSCSKSNYLFSQDKSATNKAANESGRRHEKRKAAEPSDTAQKKMMFFSFMKPLVEIENARIMQQRSKLQSLRAAGHLNKTELQWLHQLAGQYHIAFKAEPDVSTWQQLMQRVDEVPLEMALVQAANESAWGQSRFARDANNYFGQWCYEKGCGLVPLKRTAGATHEVKSFATANL